MCRHYWPLSILLALVSKRFRLLLLTVAVGEAAYEWVRLELVNPAPGARVGWWRFMVLKRLDALDYGAGPWQGGLSGRNIEALYRSEELPVGKGGFSTVRSRWSP